MRTLAGELRSLCWLRTRYRIQVLSMPFFEGNQCPEVERVITPTCHQVANQFRYRAGIEISSALYQLGGEILAQQWTQMPSEPHPHGRVQSHFAPLEDAFRQPILSSLPEKALALVPPQLRLPRHASQKFDELVVRVGATNL